MNKCQGLVTAVALWLLLYASSAVADPLFDGILDSSTIRADVFRTEMAGADGSGVAIAVLDCGVDTGLPGLTVTPSGGPKIVVARDFTGEGLVQCARVDPGPDGVIDTGRFKVSGVPGSQQGQVWAGVLEESSFARSSVPDLNGDGRSDGRFVVVVIGDGNGGYRALVDHDGDGDVSDSTAIETFEKSRQVLKFGGAEGRAGARPLSAAVNIDPVGSDLIKVDFHMATGAHGTHVAGIAAGYGIADQKGFDGIAPGAVVLSLKIGHNGLGGSATVTGSMKAALEYAADWGRRNNTPVVVNLSYGIGSEIEGYSEIDQFCDEFAVRNPHVVIVTSAGNLGPGLSTVGTPAASSGVLSVAALLTPSNAAEIVGVRDLPGIKVFGFSSRGGEIAKPDIAAPGIAASTVPGWLDSDVMAGTSMASPQVAGAAALILSAMLKKYPEAAWNSGMVMRALRDTARPLSGWTALDCGAGLADVPAAWRSFAASVARDEGSAVQYMKVSVDVPTLGGRKGGAAFWRAGGWFPTSDSPATVYLKPEFSKLADEDTRASWFGRFTLSTDARWVGLSKRSVHMRGDGEARFDTWVEDRYLPGPGVHVAQVRGVSPSGVSFSFPVTAVVPWPSRPDAGVNKISFKAMKVGRGDVKRIPFVIPPGVGMIGLKAIAAGDSRSRARVVVYDGYGHPVAPLSGMVDRTAGDWVDATAPLSAMIDQGTCEVVIAADAGKDALLDVDLSFYMLDVPTLDWFELEPGKAPWSMLDVVNNMGDAFIGRVEGRVEGFTIERVLYMRGASHEEGFSAGDDVAKVEIELELPSTEYNRFTDIAVSVLDSSGKAVVSSGFSQRRVTVSVPGAQGKGQMDYRLEIQGGLALGGGEIPVSMTIRYFVSSPVGLVGTVDGNRLIRLYPGISQNVRVTADSVPPAIPPDATWFGHVDFVDRQDGTVRGTAEVRATLR